MIIMFHCDVLSNQNVIGNALMWVKNWDSCPQSGPLCSDILSLSGDILLEPEHPLPGLISSFRVTLILGNLLRLKNETAVLGAVEVLKCDQNIILMFQLPTLQYQAQVQVQVRCGWGSGVVSVKVKVKGDCKILLFQTTAQSSKLKSQSRFI